MQKRKVIECGKGKRKRKMIVVNHASDVDKTREAVLVVMGKDRWEYVDGKKEE